MEIKFKGEKALMKDANFRQAESMLTGNPFKFCTDLEFFLPAIGTVVGHNSEEVSIYWENKG